MARSELAPSVTDDKTSQLLMLWSHTFSRRKNASNLMMTVLDGWYHEDIRIGPKLSFASFCMVRFNLLESEETGISID